MCLEKMRNILFTILSALILVGCKSALPGDKTVCFFGSSVCKGVGADSLRGYAYLVGENLPEGWTYVNNSVSGNNTFDLFARFDTSMTPIPARYVVMGVSLGNEGLHETGERAMLSYRENMPRLIKMLQDQGRTVIVANNYSRADFNEVDFRDLCEMNLEVHQWDVPSVNLFGNIDDGAGHWAEGFWNGEDIWHPNTLGHAQMASAFVPSIWEALEQDKPLPVRDTLAPTATGVSSLSFRAEPGLCSYTLSYISADTLYTTVHSALRNETLRYMGDSLISRGADEVIPEEFTVSGTNLRQLLFYRAAMTPMEIHAIAEGKMLRSSLEIYCPLPDTDNKAQSLNQTIVIK